MSSLTPASEANNAQMDFTKATLLQALVHTFITIFWCCLAYAQACA